MASSSKPQPSTSPNLSSTSVNQASAYSAQHGDRDCSDQITVKPLDGFTSLSSSECWRKFQETHPYLSRIPLTRFVTCNNFSQPLPDYEARINGDACSLGPAMAFIIYKAYQFDKELYEKYFQKKDKKDLTPLLLDLAKSFDSQLPADKYISSSKDSHFMVDFIPATRIPSDMKSKVRIHLYAVNLDQREVYNYQLNKPMLPSGVVRLRVPFDAAFSDKVKPGKYVMVGIITDRSDTDVQDLLTPRVDGRYQSQIFLWRVKVLPPYQQSNSIK